jgi:hypothetical protein
MGLNTAAICEGFLCKLVIGLVCRYVVATVYCGCQLTSWLSLAVASGDVAETQSGDFYLIISPLVLSRLLSTSLHRLLGTGEFSAVMAASCCHSWCRWWSDTLWVTLATLWLDSFWFFFFLFGQCRHNGYCQVFSWIFLCNLIDICKWGPLSSRLKCGLSSLNVPVSWTHKLDNGSKGRCYKQGFGWSKGAFMDGPHVSQDRDVLWARGTWPWTNPTHAGMSVQRLLISLACCWSSVMVFEMRHAAYVRIPCTFCCTVSVICAPSDFQILLMQSGRR